MNLRVVGNQTLSGTITPSGSKNSIVALLPATLLFNEPVTLENVPDITDVAKLIKILESFGSKITRDLSSQKIVIDNSNLNPSNMGANLGANMRGSALLWGPLLARFGKVSFADLPGGCTLGNRPLDPHFKAFKDLGVTISSTSRSSISMEAKSPKPSTIWLSEMSPTVTENIIMFATSLSGTTTITGAASEPNVQDLCNFLVAAGAKISGIGSNILSITGPTKLSSVTHKVIPDHYEIATFLALGAATGGKISVKNALPEHFAPISHEFAKLGIRISYTNDTATASAIERYNQDHKEFPTIIRSQPWPALPVDLLPIFIALSLASGHGNQFLFHNWMYEAGLFWTSELQKFNGNVLMIDPHRVLVTPGNQLFGAQVESPYIIRAAVALVMTAMLAQGESLIQNADAIHRGHPNFVKNLSYLGAKIEETQ